MYIEMQNPWSISMTSYPVSSQRSRRGSRSSSVRVERNVVHPYGKPETGRDGRVELGDGVVVQLPERNQAVATGVVEHVFGPAPVLGRTDDHLGQLEAHGLGVEAMGLGQISHGECDVMEGHRLPLEAAPNG